MQTRLFFASIWAAGTVAATSLGWTAVALVAQRVGDEPIVEQSLVVLPLNTNTSPTPSRSGAGSTEVAGVAAGNVLGGAVGNVLTVADPIASTLASIRAQPLSAHLSDTEAEMPKTGLVIASRSTNLAFDQAWTAENSRPRSTVPSATPAHQNAASTTQTNSSPSASALLLRQQGIATRAQVQPTQVQPTQIQPRQVQPTQIQPTQREVHPNPEKAFETALTTTHRADTPTASAKLAKPPSTRRFKPPISPISEHVSKRPTDLAPSAGPSNAPADEFSNPIDQSTFVFAPSEISQAPTAAIEPPLLIITAAPTPLSAIGTSPSVLVTIAPSAIIITNSPSPSLPALSMPTSNQILAAAAPAGATSLTSPATVGTATKPATVTQQAYQLSNGTVGVHCIGNQIVLDFATPAPGVSVSVKGSGPDQVQLRFKSTGDSGRSDSEFTATCVRGTPTREN